jgi:PIN domain nuclease of toxin-antitoxin system
VLLDTHVWVWLVADAPGQLGPRTRRRLAKASGARAASVSVASVFEIAALQTAGRLQFTQPVERWIRESIERSGFRVIGMDRDIAVDAGLIPASSLSDPFDRCLVATAREYEIPLVTRYRTILDYAKRTGLVPVVDAAA